MNSANEKKTHRKAIRVIAASTGLTALILLSGACAKKAPEQPKMVLPVVTEAVSTKDFPVFVSTFGNLTAINDVNIKAQVSGKIIAVKFTEGQFVNAGDTLFVIDKAPYKAAYDAAQGTLMYDEANHEYNMYLVEANKVLNSTSAMAKQTYEQYLHNASASAGKVASDKASLETAAINLTWCDIKASCAGITGKQLVDPGNVVATADNPTLVSITSIDPINADFTVPEKYFPQIRDLMKKGELKVEARPQGDPFSYEGVVSMIDNKVDNASGTLGLRASIKNPERKLWPGQFINVKLVFSVIKNAMVVPIDAVQNGSAGPYVFVMREGKAMKEDVSVGQSDADLTVVLKGDIKTGERVIKVGTMLLSPGAEVMEAQLANAAFAQKMAAAMAAKMGGQKPAQAANSAQQGKDPAATKTEEKR